MKFTSTTALLSIILSAHLVFSKSCDDSECVELYRGSDCQGAGELTNYVPTCNNGCFQYSSFDSVRVSGSGFEGTDCHIFSDPNCQNEITDTGNEVQTNCVNAPGAQSMICYFDC
ncbi:hypothetical protein B0H14DRAFT_3640120 [Mycena olivaceomarginata]|nr:hypothetical protein B0H14DRAFT_3640120 [Mycena olivaceomarginata]